MFIARLILVLALGALSSGCRDTKAPAPPDERFVTVMTRNLYVGMDFTEVLRAAEESTIALLQQAYTSHQLLIESQPLERMARIAEEIIEVEADVVGLQEVFEIHSHGVVQFDFLQLLIDALTARGANYDVAVAHTAMDIPAAALPPDDDAYPVRVVDRQAILVRRGIEYWDPEISMYDTFLLFDLGITSAEWRRGATAVSIRIHDRELRFINTHLETQQNAEINVAQGLELVDIALESTLPVVLVGDFNSAANPSAPAHQVTATYGNVIGAGFSDAWLASGGGIDGGLTCCHDHDLRNPPSVFDVRMDFVFFRGLGETAEVTIVGHQAGEQTASGRWPSDHAGLAARLRLP
jgi:endonuclease/exonuclease/phosphatase family metal-dependent hydrolase